MLLASHLLGRPETRDAAKYPIMHRTELYYLAQNVNSREVQKL